MSHAAVANMLVMSKNPGDIDLRVHSFIKERTQTSKNTMPSLCVLPVDYLISSPIFTKLGINIIP
jgi:hypothetical protein